MIGLLKLPLMGLLLVMSSTSQDTEKMSNTIQNNKENLEETTDPNSDSPKTSNIEKPTYEYPTMSSTRCVNCSLPNILVNNLTSAEDVTKESTEVANDSSKLINDSLRPVNRRSIIEPINRDLFSHTQAMYESKDGEFVDKSYMYPSGQNEQYSEIKQHNGLTIGNEGVSHTVPKEQDEAMTEFKRDKDEIDGNDNFKMRPQENYNSDDLNNIETRSSSNFTTTNSAIEPIKSSLTAQDGFSNIINYSILEDKNENIKNVSTENPLSSRSLGLVRTTRPSIENGSGTPRTSFPIVENIAKFLSAIIKPTDPFAIFSDVLSKPKPSRSNVLSALEAEQDTDDGPIVYPFCENPPCIYLRCPEPCTCPKFCHKSSKPSCKCCPECQPLR